MLFPYINGEDLNSRPDSSASRWAINFHDWDEDRAREYSECFGIVERDVKPQRLATNQRDYRELWWRYARLGLARNRAIAGLVRVLVIALVSRTAMPTWAPTNQVFSHKLGVFATDRDAMLTLLSSNAHSAWAWKNSSTMKADLNYSPSDCFETFVQPELTARMDRVGVELHEFRRSVMLGRELGLTKLYNRVHDEAITEPDIVRLREIHVEVDEAVAEAYGWTDLDLRHGFYDTRQGRRFTIDPVVQVEILDRLLELNFERYEQEVKGGRRATKRASAKVAADPAEEGMLF